MFVINSTSMYPTLKYGARVVVSPTNNLTPGAIVVFRRPPHEDCGGAPVPDLVKRVIGLPGQTIQGQHGAVYINGKRLMEPWLPKATNHPSSPYTGTFGPVKIPAGDYFMMGDNRTDSCDSRDYGPVPGSYIVGEEVRVIPDSPPAPTTTTTLPTAPATTAATVPTGTVVSASVSVVVCPTTFGVSPPAAKSLPASIRVTVPRNLVGQVAFYSDDQGTMELLGPTGWVCTASYGANGSGGVSVYPTGASAPHSQPFEASTAEAIVASETSVCLGCREQQACALFASAANDLKQTYGTACRKTRPAAEAVTALSTGVVAFMDPPSVAGDGSPSGGPFPANGVMTYYSGNENGSWLDTCTLPASDHLLCTAALNLFTSDYGNL
jgi:signal peptidase I